MNKIKSVIMANSLHGFSIHALDGPIGHIQDFFFNDQTWSISNIVVDLGTWLPGRKVLLLPDLLGHADWLKKYIETSSTKAAIENSPDWNTAVPVGLQTEKQKHQFVMQQEPYALEAWWAMSKYEDLKDGEKYVDPHLRSTLMLKNCDIETTDHKTIGTVQDFLIDSNSWEIRYLMMGTSDSRTFLTEPGIICSINNVNTAMTIVQPEEERTEWLEYDPHHMALLEMGNC